IQCFESKSNFILMRSPYSDEIIKQLQEAGIFVRKYSSTKLKDCLRVTIGTRAENDKFYETVKEVLYERA
ncbi:MAG TPA: aminotransferase class I/II-fold pyridoxal phosphate-dependent enzyme, partial [Bacillota bacterium]|nr:aminotransferase class I/II-fold pyridoxal phosphate-dependent enzyme [Bacillota bacterium]